jgi:Spermidine synthase
MLTVVQRGESLRLNGPEGTYSYYHPEHIFTGLGWDAESASLLLVRDTVSSILLLGLGGGTVARQCRKLFPKASIVGVELDQDVIDLAYRSFHLRSIRLKAVKMSGEEYLKKTARKFDAIIDDMWLPHCPEQKPVLTDPDWSRRVFSRLNRGGLYAVNLYARSESRYHASPAVKRLAGTFSMLREVRPGPGETTVIAAGSDLCTPRESRSRLRRLPPEVAHALGHVSFHTIHPG